jgi:type I restriction enzyme S subunit
LTTSRGSYLARSGLNVSVERWAIPPSWKWLPLGEIGLIAGGGTPNAKEMANFSDEGTPWITPADLSGYKGTRISRGRRSLSDRGLMTSGATLLPADTVLFSSRAPIGYCVLADVELTTSQGFKNVILNPAMSPEYVRLYLAGSAEYAESRASGTTFKELSAAKFAALRIPVPPPNEQGRIADQLGAIQKRELDAASAIGTVRRASVRLRDGLFKSAFTGELTSAWRSERRLETSAALVARSPEPDQPRGGRKPGDRVKDRGTALKVNGSTTVLPDGWSWQPLLRLARQESGHTPSRSVSNYWDGGIPWLSVKDAALHHGGVIRTTAQTISENGLANSSARILPADTVLMCRTAGSIGYVCRLGVPMATSQDFVAWTCGPALDPAYLTYLLMGERPLLRRLGRGSAHPTIYLPEIRAFSIALPPLAEQIEIARRLRELIVALDAGDAETDAAARLQPLLAREVHAKAFCGELVYVTEKTGMVEAALIAGTMELEMKKPIRRLSASRSTDAQKPSASEQLAAKYDAWPSGGYSFEDLRGALEGNYEEVRAAIFAELRARRLSQRFDERRRTMVLTRPEL